MSTMPEGLTSANDYLLAVTPYVTSRHFMTVIFVTGNPQNIFQYLAKHASYRGLWKPPDRAELRKGRARPIDPPRGTRGQT
jgi:hypothetical protein